MQLPQEGTYIGGLKFSKRQSGAAWEYIVYPESAPSDWIENLTQQGLEFAISPLHDKDITGQGEQKKAHYHVLLIKQTKWQTAAMLCDITNGPCCIPVSNVRGKYDYLTHKNDPNKAQYDPTEIQRFNGFDIAKYENLTSAEVSQIMWDLTNICRDECITEYSELIAYIMENMSMSEFDVASRHTIYFTNLVKGIWRRTQSNDTYDVDRITGELIEDTEDTEE